MIDFLLECAWISFQAGIGAALIGAALTTGIGVLVLIGSAIGELATKKWG